MKIPGRQFFSLAPSRVPRCSTARQAVYLALAAIVVACGDNVTAPSVTRTPTISEAPPDVIVMQRTIDIAAHDGIAAVHRTSTQTLTAQVRIRQDQLSPTAANKNQGFDAAHPPLPTMSLPARYESAICGNQPRWTQNMAIAKAGSNVELIGVGDAPASTLRVMQDGKVVSTIERTWVRTSTTWQLERQVTASADGRFRDVVTYQHLTAARGQPVSNALPVAACLTPFSSATITSPVAASRSYYAPSGISKVVTPKVGVGCDDGFSSSSGDPCFDKRNAVYKAEAVLVILSGAMTYACTVPEPVIVPACVAAGAAYLGAVVNLQFAHRELDNCIATQAEKQGCKCPGGAGLLIPPGTIVGALLSGSPSTTGTIHAPTSPSMIIDCSTDGFGGGGGTAPGGTGGGSLHCSYKVWEITRDGGKTWTIWGTFWTCFG